MKKNVRKPVMLLAASTIAFATMFAPMAMAADGTAQTPAPVVTINTQAADEQKPADQAKGIDVPLDYAQDKPVTKTVKDWKLTAGDFTATWAPAEGHDKAQVVVFDKDGKTLYTGTADKNTKAFKFTDKDNKSVEHITFSGDDEKVSFYGYGTATFTAKQAETQPETDPFEGFTADEKAELETGTVTVNVDSVTKPVDWFKPTQIEYWKLTREQLAQSVTFGVKAVGGESDLEGSSSGTGFYDKDGNPVDTDSFANVPENATTFKYVIKGGTSGKVITYVFSTLDKPAEPAPNPDDSNKFTADEQKALSGLKAVTGADGKTEPVEGWDTTKTDYQLADVASVTFTTDDAFNQLLNGELKWYDAAGNPLTPYSTDNDTAARVVKAVYTVTGKASGHKVEFTFSKQAATVPDALKDVTVSVDGKDQKLGDPIKLDSKPQSIVFANLPEGYTVDNATKQFAQPKQDVSKFTPEQQDAFKNLVISVNGIEISKAGDAIVSGPKAAKDTKVTTNLDADKLNLTVTEGYVDKDGNLLDPAKGDDLSKAVGWEALYFQKSNPDAEKDPAADDPYFDVAVLFDGADPAKLNLDVAYQYALNADQFHNWGAVANVLDKDGKTAFTQSFAWADPTVTPTPDPNKPGDNQKPGDEQKPGETPAEDKLAALKDLRIVADGKAVSFDYKGGEIKLGGKPQLVVFSNVPDGWTVSNATKSDAPLAEFTNGKFDTRVVSIKTVTDVAEDAPAGSKGTVFVTYRSTYKIPAKYDKCDVLKEDFPNGVSKNNPAYNVDLDKDKKDGAVVPDGFACEDNGMDKDRTLADKPAELVPSSAVSQDQNQLTQVSRFADGVAPAGFTGTVPQIAAGKSGDYTVAYSLVEPTNGITFADNVLLPLTNNTGNSWTVNADAIKDTGFTVSVSNGDAKADYKFTWTAAEQKKNVEQKLAQTGVSLGVVSAIALSGLGLGGGLNKLSKRFRKED